MMAATFLGSCLVMSPLCSGSLAAVTLRQPESTVPSAFGPYRGGPPFFALSQGPFFAGTLVLVPAGLVPGPVAPVILGVLPALIAAVTHLPAFPFPLPLPPRSRPLGCSDSSVLAHFRGFPGLPPELGVFLSFCLFSGEGIASAEKREVGADLLSDLTERAPAWQCACAGDGREYCRYEPRQLVAALGPLTEGVTQMKQRMTDLESQVAAKVDKTLDIVQILDQRQREQGDKLERVQDTLRDSAERKKARDRTIQDVLKRIDMLEECSQNCCIWCSLSAPWARTFATKQLYFGSHSFSLWSSSPTTFRAEDEWAVWRLGASPLSSPPAAQARRQRGSRPKKAPLYVFDFVCSPRRLRVP